MDDVQGFWKAFGLRLIFEVSLFERCFDYVGSLFARSF